MPPPPPPAHDGTTTWTFPNAANDAHYYPYLRLLADLQRRAWARTPSSTSADADAGDDPDGPSSSSSTFPSIDDVRRRRDDRHVVKCDGGTTTTTTTSTNKDDAPSNANASGTWDLSDDAKLVSVLREFTIHAMRRVIDVSSEVRTMQLSINDVGADMSSLRTEYCRLCDAVFLEQSTDATTNDVDDDCYDIVEIDGGVTGGAKDDANRERPPPSSSLVREGRGVGARNGDVLAVNDDMHGEDDDSDDEDDDDDSSASIARLETEERSAISDGMKALRLFYDPNGRTIADAGGNGGDDHDAGEGGGGVGGGRVVGDATVSTTIENDDDIGREVDARDGNEGTGYVDDWYYYYPCADDDTFNQRPLPFIIGSGEFMDSDCAGLG